MLKVLQNGFVRIGRIGMQMFLSDVPSIRAPQKTAASREGQEPGLDIDPLERARYELLLERYAFQFALDARSPLLVADRREVSEGQFLLDRVVSFF
jgi:hypothetical protein